MHQAPSRKINFDQSNQSCGQALLESPFFLLLYPCSNVSSKNQNKTKQKIEPKPTRRTKTRAKPKRTIFFSLSCKIRYLIDTKLANEIQVKVCWRFLGNFALLLWCLLSSSLLSVSSPYLECRFMAGGGSAVLWL